LDRRALGLFGQDDLSAEALIIGSQGAEVDTAGATAPLRILAVRSEVAVAGLLLGVRRVVTSLQTTSAICP
jgi:hypothetical protein